MNNEEHNEDRQMIVAICNYMKKVNEERENTASQIEQLTRRVERLERIVSVMGAPQRTEIRSMVSATVSKPLGSSCNPPKKTEPMTNNYGFNGQIQEITNAYNELVKMGNTKEIVERRREFFTKYKGLPICCANAEERRQNGAIPMKFAERGSSGSEDYWAFPCSAGEYIVFPRSGKQYEESVHNTGGYKEVFDSGYVAGKLYDTIEVSTPAVFSKVPEWQVRQRGRLILR